MRAAWFRAPALLAAALLGAGWGRLAGKWYVYEDCSLEDNPYNDGDSFHVRAGRSEYVFRLYFADAPETDPTLEDRIGEQAEYWGVDAATVLVFGKRAKRFTAEFLRKGFTVYTRKEDAGGRDAMKRSFAVVTAAGGDLAEALVAAGLARAFGAHVDLPDGTGERKFYARLKALERTARRERLGVWGGLPRPGEPRRAAEPAPAPDAGDSRTGRSQSPEAASPLPPGTRQ
jgi:endonuclease YncB( thermonuclease family)